MGDDQERKRKRQYRHLRDKALSKFTEQDLWSSRPDILAQDFVVVCEKSVDLEVDDTLHLECMGEGVRAVAGCQEVGLVEDPGALPAAMRERGGVVTATVKERSALGDLIVRIRKEKN